MLIGALGVACNVWVAAELYNCGSGHFIYWGSSIVLG